MSREHGGDSGLSMLMFKLTALFVVAIAVVTVADEQSPITIAPHEYVSDVTGQDEDLCEGIFDEDRAGRTRKTAKKRDDLGEEVEEETGLKVVDKEKSTATFENSTMDVTS